MLICNAPNITNVADSSYYGTRIQYMLMLDGAESPNFINTDLRLTLQPNPIFTGIDPESRSISVDDVNDITIKVSRSNVLTNNCFLLNRE